MKSLFVTIALAIVMVTCGQAAYAQGIPVGVKGSVPLCTHASLHAGTCQQPIDGYLATLSDGNPADADRCAAVAVAGGAEQVTCRRKGGDWEELEPGDGAGTNLGTTVGASDLTVTSDTGADALIPAATGSTAGAQTAADKTKLDAIEAGATADQSASEVPFVNTLTGFIATQVQAAIDELYAFFFGMNLVHSWSEVEAVMRAHDLSGAGPYTQSVSVSILFASDFDLDPLSTTSHVINLSTGGGEHPQYRINLNGLHVTADALEVLVLEFGNVLGKCGATPGFYVGTDGCMGVAHDYDVIVESGVIESIYSTCDASPTVPCGRKGLVTRNADNIWNAGSAFGSYGGRLHVHDVKIGADLSWTAGSLADAFSLIGDACLEFEPPITLVDIRGGQWDCITAVRMDNWDTGMSGDSSVNIELTDFRWTTTGGSGGASGTDCYACAAGMFDIQESMYNASLPGLSGAITASNVRAFGPLGNTRGGNFDLDVHGFWVGSGVATSNCWDNFQHDDSYFLNNGEDPADVLMGHIRYTGEMCTRGWVKSNTASAFSTEAHLFGELPGFIATDAQIATTSATRIPVLASTNLGVIESANFGFQFDVRPDTSDIAYSDLIDADVLSGAALSSATSIVKFDLGPDGFCQVVGSTPELTCSKVDPAVYASGKVPTTLDPAGFISMDSTDMDGGFLYLTATGSGSTSIILPDAVAGDAKCFYDDGGTGIVVLVPQAGDRIQLDGVLAALGEAINSPGAVGDFVCLIGKDDSTFATTGRSGAWVEATP